MQFYRNSSISMMVMYDDGDDDDGHDVSVEDDDL